jgi:hypothetical protein
LRVEAAWLRAENQSYPKLRSDSGFVRFAGVELSSEAIAAAAGMRAQELRELLAIRSGLEVAIARAEARFILNGATFVTEQQANYLEAWAAYCGERIHWQVCDFTGLRSINSGDLIAATFAGDLNEDWVFHRVTYVLALLLAAHRNDEAFLTMFLKGVGDAWLRCMVYAIKIVGEELAR